MKKYEICVVSKEYRYVTVEAESELEAKEQVWELLDFGMDELGWHKTVGTDTEVLGPSEFIKLGRPSLTDQAREMANQIFGFKGDRA